MASTVCSCLAWSRVMGTVSTWRRYRRQQKLVDAKVAKRCAAVAGCGSGPGRRAASKFTHHGERATESACARRSSRKLRQVGRAPGCPVAARREPGQGRGRQPGALPCDAFKGCRHPGREPAPLSESRAPCDDVMAVIGNITWKGAPGSSSSTVSRSSDAAARRRTCIGVN